MPKAPGPPRLSATVIYFIERLGGVLEPAPEPPAPITLRTVVGIHPVPEQIRQFLDDVRWPLTRQGHFPNFRSRWDDFPHGVLFVRGEIQEAYGCCGTHPYVQIAEDATQFLYFVRLDDRRPSNPLVYRIDHEGQDRFGTTWRLSDFLAELEPEPEE
ncbi:MAG TPA: hypothetical protein VH540_04025 [Ktedonobacterales bacterium]